MPPTITPARRAAEPIALYVARRLPSLPIQSSSSRKGRWQRRVLAQAALKRPTDRSGEPLFDGCGHVFEADVDAVAAPLEASPRAEPGGRRRDEGGTVVVRVTPRDAESASHQDVLGVALRGRYSSRVRVLMQFLESLDFTA